VIAWDIFTKYFDDETLKGLPLDTNITLKQPNQNVSDVLIFIGGEMPYWVNKIGMR
jgi:hypothetical protein